MQACTAADAEFAAWAASQPMLFAMVDGRPGRLPEEHRGDGRLALARGIAVRAFGLEAAADAWLAAATPTSAACRPRTWLRIPTRAAGSRCCTSSDTVGSPRMEAIADLVAGERIGAFVVFIDEGRPAPRRQVRRGARALRRGPRGKRHNHAAAQR